MLKIKFRDINCEIVDSASIKRLRRFNCFGKNNNKHIYGIRHSDNDWSKPSTVENFVSVNRWGFLVCDKPLKELKKKDSYINLTKKEINMFMDDCILF